MLPDFAPMELTKFRPRVAVEILVDPKQPIYFKTWSLARLIAWMCLDQRPGKRTRNPRTGRATQRRFRTRDAKLGGHLVLAFLLDRGFQPGRFVKTDENLRGMFSLFFTSGGFGMFLRSPRGARGWLTRMKRADLQLRYVYLIVEYLYRCQRSNIAGDRTTIEYAKLFVEQKDLSIKSPKRRTISKYWEINKQAAPYIFAFYKFFLSAVEQTNSIEEFIEALQHLANAAASLKKIIGQAASTADILAANKVRDVRRKDFRGVNRVEPPLEVFSAGEIQIINELDPHKLSKKDIQDYRPKETSIQPRQIS